MIRKTVGSILLVLALTLLGAGAVLAGPDPAQADPLYNETPISGTLTGSRGGAFAYYKVNYPGNGNVVSVELSVSPGDPAAMKGISLKLYSASGTELGVVVPTGTGLAVPYSDDTQGTWTVQIGNYLDGVTVAYTIVAKGLPKVQTPVKETAPAAPQAANRPAVTVKAPTPSVGALAGNNAGAFARIELDYPADGSEMHVTLNYSPADPATRRGVGLTVYGPNGQSWKGQPGATPGEIKAIVASSAAGKYEAVVWNYISGFSIDYKVTQ